MDKDFVTSYYTNKHLFRLGLFTVLSLLFFCFFIPFPEDWYIIKYFFLVFIVFIFFLIGEFIYFTIIRREFKNSIVKKDIVQLACYEIIVIKKKQCGITFMGKSQNGKIITIHYYSMEKNLQKKADQIGHHPYLECEYYPTTKVIKTMHSRDYQ